MGFERAFKLSSYLLLLSGFLSLVAAGGVDWGLAGFYLVAVVASWTFRGFELSNRIQLLLVFAALTFFVADVFFLSEFGPATVHLLIVFSLVKLFTRKRGRDYLLIYFLSLAFLLMAPAYTLSIVFLVSLICFIFFAILTFILFESKKAYEENRSAHFSLGGYTGVALVITILIVLISAPIFVAIPRGALRLFRADAFPNHRLAGFSGRVKLGDIGRIMKNPAVVMRVRVDAANENLPEDLKWRGIALDNYDGKGWSNRRKVYRPLQQSQNYPNGFWTGRARRHGEFRVGQNIVVDPFTNVVFGAPDMILIAIDWVANRPPYEDGNNSFFLSRRRGKPLKYTVFSDLISRNEKLVRAMPGHYPEEIKEDYLQLPKVNPRIVRLAEEFTRQQEGSVGKALILECALRENYGYSLENRSAAAADPLYDFLFVTREGHCEYFATAQAVMLRSLGIPARIVNGFRRGEFNEWSEYFIVRQSDAHSWVEAYFAGAGWVAFDPTPSVFTRPPFYLARLAGHLMDTLHVFWTELVSFDRFKQVGFFRAVRSKLRGSWEKLLHLPYGLNDLRKLKWDGFKGWERSSMIAALVFFLSLGFCWTFYRYRRYLLVFWKSHILEKPDSEIVPDYYREMLDVLKRKGFVRKPSETPAEFAARIQVELRSTLPAQITEVYYRSRFGNFPLRRGALSEIYMSLRELQR